MPEQPPVGSVAEEAARLVEAFARHSREMGRQSWYRSDDEPADPDDDEFAHEAADEPERGRAYDAAFDATFDAAYDAPDHTPDQPPEPDPGRQGASSYDGQGARRGTPRQRTCAQCGAASEPADATPLACRVCPVCQGIAVLRQVRPETLERIAELAAAVAQALREVAAAGRQPPSRASEAPDATRGGGRASVQRIPVVDLAGDGQADEHADES